jgi:phage baseplate assembly protein W
MADAEHERQSVQRRVLGFSLACPQIAPGTDLGRDLTMEEDDNGLDFVRVERVDALAQSLEIALTTALGSDVFNTGFGFDGLNAMAEGSSPVMTRERVRISVIDVLKKDPRVRDILDVKLEDDRLASPGPGSRTLDVRVAFETLSGDPVTVDLGRVVPGG